MNDLSLTTNLEENLSVTKFSHTESKSDAYPIQLDLFSKLLDEYVGSWVRFWQSLSLHQNHIRDIHSHGIFQKFKLVKSAETWKLNNWLIRIIRPSIGLYTVRQTRVSQHNIYIINRIKASVCLWVCLCVCVRTPPKLLTGLASYLLGWEV